MQYTFTIQFGDTDPAGIVYYPHYYRWMDDATHALFAAIGYPTKQLLAAHIAIPLVEAHCVFKSPGYYHQLVTVKTNVVFVKDKVVKIRHTFYEGTRVLAEGYEVRMWVSAKGGQLQAMSIAPAIREKLEQLIHITD